MVQLAVALVLLAVFPSPVRSAWPVVLGASAAVALVVGLGVRFAPRHRTSRMARAWRTAAGDVRDVLLARRAWPAVTVASVLVVAGHVGVFFVAAHAVGSAPSVRILLPLAVVVLLGAAVPANIGGWGPREGVAAWAFAAAGFGADRGVATATAFGVLVLIASLPGAAVLAANSLRRTPAAGRRPESPRTLVGADCG
jgi:hypothetical protein